MDINKILDRIKHQSTFVVIILLVYSYISLRGVNSFTSPLTITGVVSFLVGIFLAIGNFFIIQISESYKNIIEELKGVINTLRTQQKFSDKRFKELVTDSSSQTKQEITKGYTLLEGEQTPNE